MPPALFRLEARQLAVFLGITLLLKAKAFSQDDNYTGYRHEFYQEDDNRMSIDTDTIGFSGKLGEHVTIDGQFVHDAISGATPTGAPPQSKWPFPSFNTLYQQDYSQLFQAAINDPNNLILYQSGYFANYQAYTNYVAQNNPQLRGQATNNAATSYHQLTNSPSFHNNNVPVTHIQDKRYAFSLAAPVTFDIHTITPQVSYSTESDYHSLGIALNYAAQLNQKNTTLQAGWSHNFDSVRDATLVNWQDKNSDEFLVGINQLLTPKSYLTAAFTFGDERGYLSDPYRGVMAEDNFTQYNPEDASLIPENRPRFRSKEVFYTSYTRFIDPLNGSADVGYRFYHDSYGIFAHTLETAWHQKIGNHLVLTPSFRYYWQSAASFYYVLVPDFDHLPPYYSADYRLSRFQSFNFSIALTYRVMKNVSIDLAYSRYIMQGLDGITSQSAYPAANVGSVGIRIWF